jgi:hypothetical protein
MDAPAYSHRGQQSRRLNSSTDQGSEKRRAGLAIIACSWPPLVELA